jgi:hypothetical protein
MARKQSRTPTRSARKTSAKRKTTKLVRWSSADIKQLKTLIRQSTPTRDIGRHLGRTEASVRQHAYRLGVSLRPGTRSARR